MPAIHAFACSWMRGSPESTSMALQPMSSESAAHKITWAERDGCCRHQTTLGTCHTTLGPGQLSLSQHPRCGVWFCALAASTTCSHGLGGLAEWLTSC